MFNLKHYKPITAISLTMTLSMAIASPLVKINPASAQLFPEQEYGRDDINYRDRDSINIDRDSINIEYRDRDYRDRRRYSTVVIPAGAEIPLEYEKEKILVTKDETIPVTLIVAANIRDNDRNTLIPYGTEIEGEIQPAGDGSRFVAQELVFPDGTRQSINGSSDIVTRTETVKRGTDTGDVLKGAAIGGAAATVLGEVFGDINIEEVIGGAALGALGGWILGGKNSVELISIDPNRDLDIVLESDLALR